MPGLALAILALYGALAFGLRMLVQLRRTGSTGVSGISPGAGGVEWAAGSLFVLAIAITVAAPVLDLVDVVEPIPALDGTAAQIAGLALAAAGTVATVGAQWAMGNAWRIGVDERERTELVTGGPFALVRNPIYAGMIPAFAGIALVAGSWVAIAGAVLLVLGLEMQTRLVEEPYLLRVHGAAYGDYASRVGRFVPGLGRRSA